MKSSDVTIVIRSVGERTAELCQAIVLCQVEEGNVIVIQEKPFFKAVLKTFEIGMECNTPYLITIDADLLLFPDTISLMVARARNCPDNCFFYQGRVLDKLLIKYRQGGPHLYFTKHLKKAMDFANDIGNEVRPESVVRNRMAEEGFPFIQDKTVYGLHDFLQYNADICRKVMQHASKHNELIARLKTYYENTSDEDLKIANQCLLDEGAKPPTEKEALNLGSINSATISLQLREEFIGMQTLYKIPMLKRIGGFLKRLIK